jgi:hypothetical protein
MKPPTRIGIDRPVLTLYQGPQDGGKVHCGSRLWPVVIYVGRYSKGDALASWGVEPCERYPRRYVLCGDGAQARYVYLPGAAQ